VRIKGVCFVICQSYAGLVSVNA